MTSKMTYEEKVEWLERAFYSNPERSFYGESELIFPELSFDSKEEEERVISEFRRRALARLEYHVSQISRVLGTLPPLSGKP